MILSEAGEHPNPGGAKMEQRYGRITIDYHYPVPSRPDPDAISGSIVRIMLAVGIGMIGILFAGIIIISSAI